jgi:hypothetical protein
VNNNNNNGIHYDEFERYFYNCSDELIPKYTSVFSDAKQLINNNSKKHKYEKT